MKKKRISGSILKRFIGRLFLTSALYLLGLVAVLLLCAGIFGQDIWHGDEPLYPLLHFISENTVLFVGLLFAAGLFAIFIYYFRKLLGYFEEVIAATEKIHEESESWITMRPELLEVENQMNAIQTRVAQSRRAAKEAEQRKNDLVMYLAHDLKTPLTSVIGYLTLLEQEQQVSPELREHYLNITLEKAQRLEDLINEFFEITRFNLTTIELSKSCVNLTRMLEQTIYEFGPMFAEKNLHCELESEKDIMLSCDPDKIQRVFDNLLRNGVIYGYEETTIHVRIKSHGEQLELIFENQGVTIPQEKLDRIFEQFYRLDSARATSSGGAGLGLAIAKEIVQLHGGTIYAKSTEEKTSFLVNLPKS